MKHSLRFDPETKTLIDDDPDSPDEVLKSDDQMMELMRDINVSHKSPWANLATHPPGD